METQYEHELFQYIGHTLLLATTRNSFGKPNRIGVGTFDELAEYLNQYDKLSPNRKRWNGVTLWNWIERYKVKNAEYRSTVDLKYLGADEHTFRAGLPPTATESFDERLASAAYEAQQDERQRRSANARRKKALRLPTHLASDRLMTGTRHDRRNTSIVEAPDSKALWILEQIEIERQKNAVGAVVG
jgi:hypothetical protein